MKKRVMDGSQEIFSDDSRVITVKGALTVPSRFLTFKARIGNENWNPKSSYEERKRSTRKNDG